MPFKEGIEKAEGYFEKLIYFWCIENYVPLKQFRNNDIHIAFYENFCKYPKKEVERLFDFIGKYFDERIYNEKLSTVINVVSV